jgi:hypothetical protein
VKWQSVAVLGLAVLWAKSGLGQVPPDPQSVLLSNSPRTVPTGRPASADPGVSEQLQTFDPSQAELRRAGDRWELVAGGVKLKDLGRSEADAREALRLVREMHLTQHGTIGGSTPAIEYWLSDGQAPQGLGASRRLLAFDPDSLRVEQVQGHWYLRDANQMLFTFGARSDDARRALDVIRRYGFNEVGYVGRPAPLMMYFVADPNPLPQVQRPVANPPAATRGSAVPSGAGRLALPATLHYPNHTVPDTSVPAAVMMQTRQLAAPDTLLPDLAAVGQRMPLDARQVQVRRDGSSWKLMAGATCIADFGAGERDAREALRVVQNYHFTEFCRIGDSPAGLAYFLVNGQAPHGVAFGLRSQSFRPEVLTLRQFGDAWVICADGRTLLRCGTDLDTAKEALRVVQHYRFDTLCWLDRSWDTGFSSPDTAALSFLVRTR